MVMAAVALDSKTAAALTRKGLRDSKAYGAGDDAHAIRAELAAEIRLRAHFVVVIEVSHTEIDSRVCRNELNVLEREIAIKMIDQAPTCDKIIADGKRMFSSLAARYEQFTSLDHAEDHHAAVAAASVCAKVRRDERFNEIRARATSPSSARSPAADIRTRTPANGSARTASATASCRKRPGGRGRTRTFTI